MEGTTIIGMTNDTISNMTNDMTSATIIAITRVERIITAAEPFAG